MGIIKVLRLGEIESYLKEVTSLSLEIKLFEEEYGDVMEQMAESAKSLRRGDMSRDVFDSTSRMLSSEKKRIEVKINATAKRVGELIGRLNRSVENSRI